MPLQSAITIFADNPAKTAYLADIAKWAGYPLVSNKEKAKILILSGAIKSPPIEQGQTLVSLNADTPEENYVRILKSPLKAATLIEIICKEMLALDLTPTTISIGSHTLDTRNNIWVNPQDDTIRLTEKETAILVCLKVAEGKPVPRQTLLDNVWAYAEGVETHTLETHIYRLRQKIEKDPSNPKILLTDGEGYKIAL